MSQRASAGAVVRAVQACLTPEELDPAYRRKLRYIPKERRALYGHCAVASEAVYELLGGKAAGWQPTLICLSRRVSGPTGRLICEGGKTHWYLENTRTGERVDPTKGQFACELDYGKGYATRFMRRGKGQVTKRAQRVIACARKRL
jgi:hypothetical protein